MPKIPYLIKRRETWYVRLRTPADLQEHYKGRREIQRSLKTRDYQEAAKRVSPVKSEIEAEFEVIRQKLRAKKYNTDALAGYSEQQLIQLTRKWFNQMLSAETTRRIKNNGGWTDERKKDYFIELQQEEHAAREELLGTSEREEHEGFATAVQFLETEGLSFNRQSENFQKLGHFFSRSIHDLAQRSLAEWSGNHKSSYNVPYQGVEEIQTNAPPRKIVTMRELLEEYMSDPSANRNESTRKNYLIIERAINEVIGADTPVHAVSRDQCKEIGRMLIELPSNAFKRTKSKTLKEAVTTGKKQNLKKVAGTTYNMYMQKLNALMDYAVRETYITSNPAKKLYVTTKSKKSERRNSFTTSQLQTIFGSPLYSDKAPLYSHKNEDMASRYWIPYIALWTGMRLNEICQLYASDITQEEGVNVILIRETDGLDDEIDTEKRVKTSNGIRFVPIHPLLQKAGFIDYVASVRKAGKTRIFPGLQQSGKGYYSHEFSKWFSRHLKSIDAKTVKTSFHSFRHSYRDAIRRAKLSRDVTLQLGGWSSGATDDDYGDGLSAKELYPELCKISYEGLDLSHISV